MTPLQKDKFTVSKCPVRHLEDGNSRKQLVYAEDSYILSTFYTLKRLRIEKTLITLEIDKNSWIYWNYNF